MAALKLTAIKAEPAPGDDGAPCAPSARDAARQQMWNVMRGPMGRDGFDLRDLMAWGATAAVSIAEAEARSFIRALLRGGYLFVVQPAQRKRPTRWRLRPKMNTGPKPPMCFRARMIFDQNLGQVVGETTAEEDRA